jgi:SAM-dependent methyltransferase
LRTGAAAEGREPDLVCAACGAAYPVRDGIPCLVHVDHTSLGDLTELLAHQAAHRNWLRTSANAVLTRDREEDYDRYADLAWRAFEQVLPEFDAFPNPRVLDVGAGDGLTSALLAERGAAVVATDLGLHMLRDPGDVETRRPMAWVPEERRAQARARVRSAPYYADRVQACADRLPFADNLFDFVFCRGVLHHVADVRKTIVEMARVLRLGGRLVVCAEPFRATLESEFERLKGIHDYLLGINEHCPRLSDYLAAFRAAGLRRPKLLIGDLWPGLRWERAPSPVPRVLRRLLRPLPWRELPVGYGPLMRFCAGVVSLVATKRRHRPGRHEAGARLLDPGLLDGSLESGPRLAEVVRQLRRDRPFPSRLDPSVAPQEGLRFGWWLPEPVSPGPRQARYSFPYCMATLRAPRGATALEVTCRGFAAETGAPTRGTVWINGAEAGPFCLEGADWQTLRFPLPPDEPIIDVEIEAEEVHVPDRFLHNGDTRAMGIAVAEIAASR